MTDLAPSHTLPALVPLQRRDIFAALLLAGVLMVIAAGRMYVGASGQCHDDGIYLVMAKSLAEGEGYRLSSLPGEPPQTKYPPLYPAILALLWRLWPVFPDNLLLLQGFSLLCGGGFLGVAYLYLVRFGHASRGLAFSAAALCAVQPSFAFFSVVVMSEMLFALLVVAMLWWLELALRQPDKHGPCDVLGGLLLALPFLCRSIGLLFLPLGLLMLWQSGKRWRWATVGALAATLPWLLWSVAAANDCRDDPVRGYYTDYLGWWTSHGLPAIAQIIHTNVMLMAAKISGFLLDGLTTPLQESGNLQLWTLLQVPTGLASLMMLLVDVKRGRALGTLLASYLLLVSIWPWVPQRFIMPLAPFLAMYLLRALMLPGRLASLEHLWPHVARVTLALCLTLGLVAQLHLIQVRHRDDSHNPELKDLRHSWAATQRLLSWLRTNSQPQDVIAAGIDPTVYLYTERQAYYPIVCPPLPLFYSFPYPTEEVMKGSLQGLEHYRPRFLVLTANLHGEDEYRAWVKLLQQRYPEMLVRVYHDEVDPRFEIFEIHYH